MPEELVNITIQYSITNRAFNLEDNASFEVALKLTTNDVFHNQKRKNEETEVADESMFGLLR